MSPWPPLSSGTQTTVPSRNPRKKPPKVRSWTMAPSRSPWTAASSISPMISRSTQSTAARVAERCTGKCAPHRYSRRAVLPRPVFHHRRVRRRSGGLCLLLAAVAITASGCALSGHPGSTKVARVLGEAKGTPLAVGQPAPSGTGELGRCLVRHGSALLGGRRRRPRSRPADRRHGDRRHHQRRRDLEGAAGRGREHPTAERGVLPHGDRVHGGRFQRGVAAGERRRHHDERRRRDLVRRQPRRRTRSSSRA